MYQRLLVPVDGSDHSARAVRESLALARRLEATVIGFVVETNPPLPAAAMHQSQFRQAMHDHEVLSQEHAHRLLAHFQAEAEAAGVPFEGHYSNDDDVAAAIARAAMRHEADLIVMVTQGRGLFGELLFGSHTKQVMALTRKPLLVLH